jgi:hypothetical protein
MVSEVLYNDLLSFDLPCIFCGDHGQLPPVEINGRSSFNLMAQPDITLETIHRNAGPIAHFANFLRQGNSPADWLRASSRRKGFTGCRGESGGKVILSTNPSDADALGCDQIICAFNRMRVGLNETIREINGYPPDNPVVGDRVMCLLNDHRLGVFNGMQGIVRAITREDSVDVMVFRVDGRDHKVPYLPEQFNNEERLNARRLYPRHDDPRRRCLPLDYAYCVTCHKAQGDEWDSVLVVEEKSSLWDHTRWAYTAASRARKRLLWIMT